MFERFTFTDRARRVMGLANQEAQRLNHEYIGTEHILLGLVKEDSGAAATVLKKLGVDLRTVRHAVEKLVKTGPESTRMGKLPFTPRAKRVVDYASAEAQKLNHNSIGTEHLLLGSLCERDGVAAQVLINLGLTLERVREEVLKLVADRPGLAEAVSQEKAADECRPGAERASVEAAAGSRPMAESCQNDAAGGLLVALVAELRARRDRATRDGEFDVAGEYRDLADAAWQMLNRLCSLLSREGPAGGDAVK